MRRGVAPEASVLLLKVSDEGVEEEVTEDDFGLCIYFNYTGPIKDGAIAARVQALGTIEETASLAEMTCPLYTIHMPDGTKYRAISIVERRMRRPPKARRGK